MVIRSGPVDVVTPRRNYKGKVFEPHLLRRTYRNGKSGTRQIVSGQLPNDRTPLPLKE